MAGFSWGLGLFFSGVCLAQAEGNLSFKTKSKLNYVGKKVTGEDWRESHLIDCDFSGSRFDGVRFQGAFLENAHWHKAQITNTDMDGLKAAHVDFSGAVFKDSGLYAADLSFADFSGARFINVDLREAVLIQSNLKGAGFDGRTRLPFSREAALKRGMVFTPTKHQ